MHEKSTKDQHKNHQYKKCNINIFMKLKIEISKSKLSCCYELLQKPDALTKFTLSCNVVASYLM